MYHVLHAEILIDGPECVIAGHAVGSLHSAGHHAIGCSRW